MIQLSLTSHIEAFNLLRNAGYEAQLPRADGRLVRSLYMSALAYLLGALPEELSTEEISMLQNHIPAPVKGMLTTSPHSAPYLDKEPRVYPNQKSYLHNALASIIVHLCILLRLILPYVKLLLHQLYEYERTHRITERILNTTLGTAEELGKGGVTIGSLACSLNEGRVGAALLNFATWWVHGRHGWWGI